MKAEANSPWTLATSSVRIQSHASRLYPLQQQHQALKSNAKGIHRLMHKSGNQGNFSQEKIQKFGSFVVTCVINSYL